MGALGTLLVQCGQRLRLAAIRADAPERLSGVRRIDDRAVGQPGRAAHLVADLGERQRGTALGGNSPQGAVAEVADPVSVRGEEGRLGTVGVLQDPPVDLVDLADENRLLAGGVDRRDGASAAVPGERDQRDVGVGEFPVAGKGDRKAQLGLDLRAAARQQEPPRKAEQQRGGDAGERPSRRPRARARRAAAVAGGGGLVALAGEDLLEHDARVGDVVQAVLRIALEAAAEEPADRRRRVRRAAPRNRSRVLRTPARVSDTVSAGEERLAGEHLVEHDAERPDVGPLVDRSAARLLGRHVGRGAEDDAELRAVHRGERRRVHDRRRAREIGRGGRRAAPRPSPWPARNRGPWLFLHWKLLCSGA